VEILNSLAENIKEKAGELKGYIQSYAYASRRSRPFLKAKCEELKGLTRTLLDKCRFGETQICFRWYNLLLLNYGINSNWQGANKSFFLVEA
jgi:hypothetical protein